MKIMNQILIKVPFIFDEISHVLNINKDIFSKKEFLDNLQKANPIRSQIEFFFNFAEKNQKFDFLLKFELSSSWHKSVDFETLEIILKKFQIPDNVYRLWVNPIIDNRCSFLNIDQIQKIEKCYEGNYVFESCILTKDMYWTNHSAAIFYQKKPHPKGSNYFAISRSKNNRLYISDGISATKPFIGLKVDDRIIYSRHHYDCRTYKNCSVDGGRDYFKYSGNGIPCNIHVKEDKLIIEKKSII